MSENEAQADSGCSQESQEKVQCFCMGTGPELFAMFKKLGPESARQHFRNARIELLKGMRELIDRRIEELSKQPEKGAKVTVE